MTNSITITNPEEIEVLRRYRDRKKKRLEKQGVDSIDSLMPGIWDQNSRSEFISISEKLIEHGKKILEKGAKRSKAILKALLQQGYTLKNTVSLSKGSILRLDHDMEHIDLCQMDNYVKNNPFLATEAGMLVNHGGSPVLISSYSAGIPSLALEVEVDLPGEQIPFPQYDGYYGSTPVVIGDNPDGRHSTKVYIRAYVKGFIVKYVIDVSDCEKPPFCFLAPRDQRFDRLQTRYIVHPVVTLWSDKVISPDKLVRNYVKTMKDQMTTEVEEAVEMISKIRMCIAGLDSMGY